MDDFFVLNVRLSRVKRWLVAAVLVLGTSSAISAVALSSLAPDFTLHTLTGPNMRLQEQRGRVVMVNFWATWCSPCRQEMPQLNKLYERYRASGLVLLGVNVDEDPRHASDVATRLGLKFPVLLDTDKAVSRVYDLGSMPSTVLIDRDGQVRYLHRGYVVGDEDLYDKQIRDLLK
jgi:peroxiredoxin